MPTGYTAAIADGISFDQFVWNCARAFGALVMLRDDSSAPIPERFEPSPFYAQHIVEAQAKLSQLRGLTREQAHAECVAEHNREVAAWIKRQEGKAALRAKYEAMLQKAQAWQAPTPEHAGLKDFMVQQIAESIEWDCSSKYDKAPAAKSTNDWLAASIAQAERELSRAEESHREEVERTESRNRWVAALRESVPIPTQKKKAA